MTRPLLRITGALLLAALGARPAQPQNQPSPRVAGDFRLRYERTGKGNGAAAFNKEVFRFRIAMSYPLRDDIVARARLSTGSPGDPNSTDITLGQFLDDLPVSLDVASIEIARKHWALVGGKFLNPFVSTELLWDGDVNPQGVAGRVAWGDRAGPSATLSAMYFSVDAQPADSSSSMKGVQLVLGSPAARKLHASAAAGYYNYRIKSLFNADAGDIRGNRQNEERTGFLSDFNLVDLLAILDYEGWAERFPLRLVGDYLHNFGAEGPNTGWEADLYLGRAQKPGDLRFRGGYALAETDAVLAAFAHDNTTLGTNSETFTFAVDAIPLTGMLLNATLYVFRPHSLLAGAPRDWQNRLRLNATVFF